MATTISEQVCEAPRIRTAEQCRWHECGNNHNTAELNPAVRVIFSRLNPLATAPVRNGTGHAGSLLRPILDAGIGICVPGPDDSSTLSEDRISISREGATKEAEVAFQLRDIEATLIVAPRILMPRETFRNEEPGNCCPTSVATPCRKFPTRHQGPHSAL